PPVWADGKGPSERPRGIPPVGRGQPWGAGENVTQPELVQRIDQYASARQHHEDHQRDEGAPDMDPEPPFEVSPPLPLLGCPHAHHPTRLTFMFRPAML